MKWVGNAVRWALAVVLAAGITLGTGCTPKRAPAPPTPQAPAHGGQPGAVASPDLSTYNPESI